MILPTRAQSTAAVAAHYDELDCFYREIWGEHLHHGYWASGRETPAEAVVSLIDMFAARLGLAPDMLVCDIGCGYGATAGYLANRFGVQVTGVTVSGAQAKRPSARISDRVSILQEDWLTNGFPAEHFDRIYAVESSEHMPDKQRFFDEAFRTLKPGGRLGICAWLAADSPCPWEIRHLLEPICREGRLPGMGDEADYRRFGDRAGFRLSRIEDISEQVRRTWWICTRRALAALLTRPRYMRFLLDRTATDRIFAVTMLRIMLAYRTRSMRYCLMVFNRD